MELKELLYLVRDKENGTWCLGFWLTGAIIFTCRHCTNGEREILKIGSSKKYEARAIGYIIEKELYRKTKNGAIYEKINYKSSYGKDMALMYVNELKNKKREIEEVFGDYRLFERVYIPTPTYFENRLRIGITKSNIIYADVNDEILMVFNFDVICSIAFKVIGMICATLGGVIGIAIGSHILYDFAKRVLKGG